MEIEWNLQNRYARITKLLENLFFLILIKNDVPNHESL